MNTRILLAGAVALVFAAGTVATPSLADAAQQFHGAGHGGGHGGGVRMGGAFHGGGYHRGNVYRGNVYRGGGYGGGYGGGVYRGGGVYYGGVCGPMQVVLGLCGPYGY